MTDLTTAPSGFGDMNFDYTFTDKELQDVLGYMERGQSGTLDPSLPFFSTATALQFQPHPNSPTSDVAAAMEFVPAVPVDIPIKQEPQPYGMLDLSALALGQTVPPLVPTPQQPLPGPGTLGGTSAGPSAGSSSTSGGGPPPPLGALCPQDFTGSGQLQAALLPQPQHHLPPAPLLPKQQSHTSLHGIAHGRKGHDNKPHVSHSTVEKQRRDRINSLIDELRELVPPHGCRDSGGGGSGGHAQGHGGHNTSTGSGGGHGDAVHDGHKRPKHVVLSDTIAMVKELQERLVLSEAALARLREHEEHCPFHDHEEHQAALRAERETSSGSHGSHPELPHAPNGIDTAHPSVEVEHDAAEGCMFVKISCKDRHGLLADLVRTLKALPIEIVTAAITTTRDGGVYDVFQVAPEEGHSVTEQEIRARLQDVVGEHHTGDKRRRDS